MYISIPYMYFHFLASDSPMESPPLALLDLETFCYLFVCIAHMRSLFHGAVLQRRVANHSKYSCLLFSSSSNHCWRFCPLSWPSSCWIPPYCAVHQDLWNENAHFEECTAELFTDWDLPKLCNNFLVNILPASPTVRPNVVSMICYHALLSVDGCFVVSIVVEKFMCRWYVPYLCWNLRNRPFLSNLFASMQVLAIRGFSLF